MTEMVLSNSRTKTWRRCPNLYRYKYVMGLKPKKEQSALRRGSWLHELFQVHYDGEDWKKRHRELTAEFNLMFEEERADLGDLPSECARIFIAYLMNYRDEDSHYKIIDSELDEVITLPNGLKFRMIIDLIVEEPDGGLWLWDHKTVKNFMDADFLLIDAQLTRYFWGAEHLGYKNLRGVIFNEVITAPPTRPELLKNGRLTERQNLRCDVYTYYREIKRLGQDPKDYRKTLARLATQNDRWFRRTRLAKDRAMTTQMMQELVYTAQEMQRAERTGHFPRTPDRSCTFGCSFLNLCQMELQGGDTAPLIKMNYTDRTDRTEDV